MQLKTKNGKREIKLVKEEVRTLRKAVAILTDIRDFAKSPNLHEAIKRLDGDGVWGDEPEPGLDDTTEFIPKK